MGSFLPCDSLHGQHEEAVHGEGLAGRAALQLPQRLHELGVLHLEPFQGAVLVDLVGAVLHVHLGRGRS